MKKIYFAAVLYFNFCAAYAQDNTNNPLSDREMISQVAGEILYI